MPDCTSGEFRDVSDLGLPGVQQQLVEAVVETGTPTVVVVVSGRAHALAVDRRARGRARLRVGAGRAGRRRDRRRAVRRRVAVGPAADLAAAQRGPGPDAPRRPRRRRPQRRSSATTSTRPRAPLFPFGFGLTYTTFEYDALAVDDRRAPTTDRRRGRRAQHRRPRRHRGRAAVSSATRSHASRGPNASSPAFARVELEPGETRDRALHRRPDARSRTTTRTCGS